MADLYLRRNLAEPNVPQSLVLRRAVPTDDEAQSVAGRIYWRWDDDVDMEPVYLGESTAGKSLSVPFDMKGRDIRLYLVSVTEDGRVSESDIRNAVQTTFSATASMRPVVEEIAVTPLFDRFADATTSGTAAEDLWTNGIGAGRLENNGDKIDAEYTGVFAANTNSKRVYVDFAGTKICNQTVTENNTTWEIEITLIRVSNTVVRYQSSFTSHGVAAKVTYGELTGLDLTGSYNFVLGGRTTVSAGDLTAKMGHAVFIPAV